VTETAGMRALLDLEESAPDQLFTRIRSIGLPIWPLARWPISRAIAETDIGTTLPTYQRPSVVQQTAVALRRSLPNPHSLRRTPQVDHLFLVSGWTKSVLPGGYRNGLADDFANALGDDAAIVQDAYVDALSRGDQHPLTPRTFTLARANDQVARRAVRHPLEPTERRELDQTMREVFELLDFPVTEAGRERAIADILRRADRARHARDAFGLLLDRTSPRRIYMQTAAYGNRAPEIALAHERGIEVAELQHGWIGSSHAAYNVGRAMRTPDLVRCLPDTLLGYGEYWGRDIRFPGRFEPIGKPTLDRTTLEVTPWDDRPRSVLFVSSNFEHDLVDRTLLALRAALPDDWTLVLRPHPVERATAARRHADVLARDGVVLDVSADGGAALAASRAVIGFSSTMLFEALAYGCHTAVIESSLAEHYASAEIFPTRIDRELTRVADAAQGFLHTPTTVEQGLADSVWRPDAIAAFRRFAAA
jgi:hypothetical protein